jgi:hypothetical protein
MGRPIEHAPTWNFLFTSSDICDADEIEGAFRLHSTDVVQRVRCLRAHRAPTGDSYRPPAATPSSCTSLPLRSTDCSGRKPKAPPSRGPLWDSTTIARSISPPPQAFASHRAGDHRRQPHLSRDERAARRATGPRWLDTGTPDSGAPFDKRQGFRIACPQEIAFRIGLIDRDRLRELGGTLDKSPYGGYLRADAGNHR